MLTGIIGALDMIRLRAASGRYNDLPRYLDAAHGSAQRAASLTQRLLAFSRRQPLQTRPTAVNSLIRSLAELLQRSLGETIRFDEPELSVEPSVEWGADVAAAARQCSQGSELACYALGKPLCT